jgi:hypothetical protein
MRGVLHLVDSQIAVVSHDCTWHQFTTRVPIVACFRPLPGRSNSKDDLYTIKLVESPSFGRSKPCVANT